MRDELQLQNFELTPMQRIKRIVVAGAGGTLLALGIALIVLPVSQVLNAAGWTYVAAFISSLIYFLWHLLPLLTGRQRN